MSPQVFKLSNIEQILDLETCLLFLLRTWVVYKLKYLATGKISASLVTSSKILFRSQETLNM